MGAIIQRSVKRGNVLSFNESYKLGYKSAWASEVDEDFDILFNAWNSGLDGSLALANGSVTTAKLADNSVTEPKIAAGAVTDGKIVSVSWSKLTGVPDLSASGPAGGVLTGTYPNPGLADHVVLEDNIVNEAVTSNKIADEAITSPKLAPGAVNFPSIGNGEVGRIKLSADVWPNPIPTGADVGKILTVNAGPTLAWATPTASAGPAGGDLLGTYPNPTVRRASADFFVTGVTTLGGKLWAGFDATFYANVTLANDPIDPYHAATKQYVDSKVGAPSGPAGGDLAGTYPNPTIGPLKVVTAAIAALNVTRAKIAADAWLSPTPVGGDVGKVLTVTTGPTLAWSTPAGGAPSGAAGGDLAGTYPSPTVFRASTAAGFSVSVSNAIHWGVGAKGHLIQGNASKRAEFTYNIDDLGATDDAAVPCWRIRLGGGTDDIQFNHQVAGPGAVVNLATMSNTGAWSMKDTLTTVIPAAGNTPELVLGTGSSPVRFRIGSITGGNFQFYSNATMNNLKDDPALPSLAWVYDAPAREFGFYGAPAGASITWSMMMALNATGCAIPNGMLTLGSRTIKSRWMPGTAFDTCELAINRSYPGGTATHDDVTKPSWAIFLDATATDHFRLVRSAPATPATPVWELVVSAVGDLTIAGGVAIKATGTAWANPSDRRLKDNIIDFTEGLALAKLLCPRRFTFNGKGGSQYGLESAGFIADEVFAVLPEMITTRRGKLDPDDDCETDIQMLDQSNLTLVLLNAVKELAARVEALEV